MPTNYTPLRYPGGKAKLGPFLANLFRANRLVDSAYAEPYAGGAGAALFLLFRGYASTVHLNDIDSAVFSFWRAILNHTERFARQVETIPLTVKEWDHQKEILRSKQSGFDLGFAFFYLNRTNRSGIANAGVIGGRRQEGPWLMDARYNRAELAERIRNVGRLRRLISVTRADALAFIDEIASSRSHRKFLYLDPPYFAKGRDLYTSFYDAEDHEAIARRVKCLNVPWLLTYDDCVEIRSLYADFPVLSSELSYSASEVRRGREIVVLSKMLRLPTQSHGRARHRPGFALLSGRATSR
jgi:DNA adenine methylase